MSECHDCKSNAVLTVVFVPKTEWLKNNWNGCYTMCMACCRKEIAKAKKYQPYAEIQVWRLGGSFHIKI